MRKKIYVSVIAVLFFFSYVHAAFTGSRIYDFKDGTIIASGQSVDGSLKLLGTYSLHGATYGLDMKVGGEIKIAVTGSSTLRFLGSAYSGLKMQAKTSKGVDLGTQNTKVATDLVDTYDFVYTGVADTLDFKLLADVGNDLYLPSIEVVPVQLGGDVTLTSPVKNIIYFFDLRDGSIIPNQTSLNGNYTITQGLFKIESGPSNGYGYNGTQHGSILKTGNRITLQVAGNSTIKIGGSIYSSGSIAVSSATGAFDKVSQASQTAANYDADGSSVDFLYVGTAGTVVLDFTGTTYVPIIEIVPIPFDVQLNPWVQKTGTITVNGIVIGLTAGITISDNAAVTVSAGTVISATPTVASIRINLAGTPLSGYTPAVTGDIASATVSHDSLMVTYANTTTKPTSYLILVADNSIVAEALPGKTYTYDFTNGSVLPQTSYQALRYPLFVTKDGIVTMKSNNATPAGQFGYHDAAHGAVFFPGNSIDMTVAGNATATFITCVYGSATDAVFEFKDSAGNVLGTIAAQNIGKTDAFASSFSYTGPKGIITATLKSALFPTAEVYIHGLSIENAAQIISSNGKIEVWDFGAAQQDTTIYKNNLTESIINSWYAPTIPVGSANNLLPSFTAGVLSWVGGTNDRLRTTNTNLTRYDANIASAVGYTGRVYVNAAAATGRYMSLTLSEDDEVTVVTRTDAGGNLNFQYVGNPAAQTDVVAVTDLVSLKFVAKAAGTYHMFDTSGKPSYFRIYRKDATYANFAGIVNVSQAPGIPAGYGIVFTNKAGKSWKSVVTNSGYNAKLPAGYTYALSLSDANGYVITSGDTLAVTPTTTAYNVSIKAVELYAVTGAITGLGSNITKLSLVFTPTASAHAIYKPVPVVDTNAATYTVQLEPNIRYKISATGVNDFYLPVDSIIIGTAGATFDLAFVAKPLHAVTINVTGLTPEQLAKLSLVFNNLYEAGYSYGFSTVTGIALRDGVYTVAYSGLDDYPVQLGLTSNLKVAGADTTKVLAFKPVTDWSFDDKPIANGTPSYKGLLFTGTVASELAKGHLTAKAGATIRVPLNVGEKMRVTYYYTAAFSINGGDTITTATNSTSILEYADYTYTGTVPGYVTIVIGTAAATTYITDIMVTKVVAYQPVITVGADKAYKTINDALAAIAQMVRGATDRVTVLIDPGNYEEMLVVTVPNVTLKNASATPAIALANKGVDIDPNAVRITSYYGHGYNYYSMGNDQKWNADVLRVNKENGYLSYENKGAGTTNGSYWNATVVVSANGFTAENIIFENSFNQYISLKESQDVVVLWASGNKGVRSVTAGSTDVQHKSFVERGAAIAITDNTDKVVLTKCRVVGRQDSFYGGTNTRVVIYKGAMMGGTDYLFGAMTAVFYKTDLAMNTSDDSGDQAYLTAAQQSSGRGYLMYACNIKSAIPAVETASTYLSKPGEFGRPWQATTSEVVFYNTVIDTTNFTGSVGKSLIAPEGWLNTLGGTSSKMYEFGTVEKSGVNNSANRASWSTVLTAPTLTDGTAITTFNFTKGTDNWDPLPDLIANDTGSGVIIPGSTSSIQIYGNGNKLFVTNVKKNTLIQVYSMDGSLVKSVVTAVDTNFTFDTGLWIVKAVAEDGSKTIKILIH
ncbi:MAG: pectinesterase family protein [Paludibacter sp.]|nr:pectinesterase family protein [Paludibacter sp.]